MTTGHSIKRARQDWQKEARGRHILDAAIELFAQSGRLPAMAEVATKAGVAKGTLYLYFSGREALWLELLDGCIGKWIAAIECLLDHKAQCTPHDVAVAIIAAARQDPLLISLATTNAVLIEPKAGLDAGERFRADTASHVKRLAHFLGPRLAMGEAERIRCVIHSYAILIGLWQMVMPTPRLPTAPGAAPPFWRIDWEREAAFVLSAIWQAKDPGAQIV